MIWKPKLFQYQRIDPINLPIFTNLCLIIRSIRETFWHTNLKSIEILQQNCSLRPKCIYESSGNVLSIMNMTHKYYFTHSACAKDVKEIARKSFCLNKSYIIWYSTCNDQTYALTFFGIAHQLWWTEETEKKMTTVNIAKSIEHFFLMCNIFCRKREKTLSNVCLYRSFFAVCQNSNRHTNQKTRSKMLRAE